MDSAKDLYDRFVEQGLQLVKATVDSKWPETGVLDFKESYSKRGQFAPDDKKNLSKALSGFANSEGGVVVWGVTCRRSSPEEDDIASELKPVNDVSWFVAELNNLTGQLTDPGVEGVAHHTILDTDQGDSGKGYVVTFIPQSKGPLHMATGKDLRQFFFRSGSSFHSMSTSQIRDRFSRRPHPKLELAYHLSVADTTELRSDVNNPLLKAYVDIAIRNCGRGLAQFPALYIRLRSDRCLFDPRGIDGKGNNGLSERPLPANYTSVREKMFGASHNEVVYPSSTMTITRIEVIFHLDDYCSTPNLECDYELFCEGFSTSGSFTLEGAKTRKFLNC